MALSSSKESKKSLGAIEADRDSGALATLCKAASDSLRLDIMRVLRSDSFGVQELAAIFAMPQPGMSHHLKILSKAGLLATRRQGNSIFYRHELIREESEFADFLLALHKAIADLPLRPEYAARIEKIYVGRSSQSRLYFEKHVDQFEENQGMLCELDQYWPNLREILDLTKLSRESRVMEVGPGQGALLKELSKRYRSIVALDNSGRMLAFTKAQLAGEDRIQFIKDSLEDLDTKVLGESLDAVVLNMVLHHMSSPQQAMQKIRQLLSSGGFLIIADLCSHNQEWAKSSLGDVWLGFDPEDLKTWAQAAGFHEEQSLYLGLKNGFQIQLKLFRAL
ncbi:MAG: metalloregulator ArsR/SmtB family transcription factor [Bdellovibrionota bacterium]